MAGHSHSSNIKFRKARVDQVRARLFTKLARMITVAARLGGGDPDANARLRLAMDKARVVSMPKDSIERAIKKGTGDLEGSNYEEVLYEGYAPGGVAVMAEVLTDNRHRTGGELRNLFERSGGNLGATGAVAWMFDRRAVFSVAADPAGGALDAREEHLLEVTLAAGADDLVRNGDSFEIHGDATAFVSIKAGLERAGITLADASVAQVPRIKVPITELELARKVVKLLDALDDHDDVQNTYANYDLSDEVAARLGADA